MKYFLALSLITLSLIAQEGYTQGKIDMHGGKDTYGSFSSRNYGGFSSNMGMSKFLDRNSTKKPHKDNLKK